ncbi:MAG: hypothetical protein JWO90_1704 [Solirubrobacterales bacterium]|nr:hypothetical protein [Solirubrobacterales bacterium]
MFSPAPDPARPATRSLRATVRNLADLTIAFMTLEGYGLDDLRRSPPERPHGQPGATTGDAAEPASTRSSARVTAERDPLLAAFLGEPSLASTDHRTASASAVGSPIASQTPAHHRPLRTPSRPGRPGTVPARERLCLSPVEAEAPAPAQSAAPRRRTAPQDAQL